MKLLNCGEEVGKNLNISLSSMNFSDLLEYENGAIYFRLGEADENGLYIKDNTLIYYDGRKYELVIPEGVTQIRQGAFVDCINLNRLVLPSTLEDFFIDVIPLDNKLIEIVNLSNVNITNLTNRSDFNYWHIANNFESAGEFFVQDNFLFYHNQDKYYLVNWGGTDKKMVLPKTDFDYYIYRFAFFKNTTIAEIEFCESVIGIYDNAFCQIEPLKSLTLPKTLEFIETRAFSTNYSLTSVIFDEDSIIETLSHNIFNAVEYMTTLVLPKSIVKIETQAFEVCHALKEITFLGTMDEWTAIEKEANWTGSAQIEVIHCSDGDIELNS